MYTISVVSAPKLWPRSNRIGLQENMVSVLFVMGQNNAPKIILVSGQCTRAKLQRDVKMLKTESKSEERGCY